MRKLLLVVALVGVAAIGTVAQSARYWPFADNTFQPSFISRIETIAHMEPQGAGHGATWEPRYARVRVLSTKSGSGCWIGNDTEPHNWTPAPVEVCR